MGAPCEDVQYSRSSCNLLLCRQITNWELSTGKAINQGKAKHGGELMKWLEGHTGQTVARCSKRKKWSHFSLCCYTIRAAADPSLCKSGFCSRRRLKRTARGTVWDLCVWPQKSFALMALRGLASSHWDEHRRLAKTNSLCHDEQMPGPSEDTETKLKTHNPPNTCPGSGACETAAWINCGSTDVWCTHTGVWLMVRLQKQGQPTGFKINY